MNDQQKRTASAADYSRPLDRALYDSPLHTRRGKFALLAVAAIMLYPALHSWISWLTPLRDSWMLFSGAALGFLGSLPALVLLRYLDRRQPESWWYYMAVLLLAALFTTAPAAFVNHYSLMPLLTVGFSEEFWKALPLLLVVFFAPTLVNGVRDGIIYGALGGLAFDVVEIGNYILRVSNHEGIDGFIFQLGRLGFGGVENHVIWSALVGGGIGMAVQSNDRRTKILAPLGAYLLASLTHEFQDVLGGALLGMAAMYVVLLLKGIDVLSLEPKKAEELSRANMADTLRIETILVNLVVLPILLRLLWTSGDYERQVVREELSDEVGEVITPAEYEGVRDEKRFRLRRVPGYSAGVGRAIRNAQNNLAFHKRYLKRKNRPVDGDPLAAYFRAEVLRLRRGTAA